MHWDIQENPGAEHMDMDDLTCSGVPGRGEASSASSGMVTTASLALCTTRRLAAALSTVRRILRGCGVILCCLAPPPAPRALTFNNSPSLSLPESYIQLLSYNCYHTTAIDTTARSVLFDIETDAL